MVAAHTALTFQKAGLLIVIDAKNVKALCVYAHMVI
jgi:hypothetical protein